VGGTKAVLLKRWKAAGNVNGKNAAGKAKRKNAAGKRKKSNALEMHIEVVDGGSSDDFMESRPTRTTGDDGSSDCQEWPETTPPHPKKKVRCKRKAKSKYGTTKATFQKGKSTPQKG
jgi:hypothetical protein